MSDESPVEIVKNVGTKCSVKEARKFYLEVVKRLQKEVLVTSSGFLENMNQSISFTKLTGGELEMILSDCDFVSNKIKTFSDSLKILY